METLNFSNIKNHNQFALLNNTEKNEFMRFKDLTYPNKKDYTLYNVVDTDLLVNVHQNITEDVLKSYGFKVTDKVQNGKFIVKTVFNEKSYQEDFSFYKNETTRRFDIFIEYLKEINNVSDKFHKIIYAKAYEDGHSGGWNEIESNYIDYAEFADAILEA